MKAVFLCAGKGTRMRPISYSVPKHLIPLANKPILQYNVEKVLETGIDDVGLVVSPEMESAYKDILGTQQWGASIEYIHQENPQGLAHAVYCAKEFVGNDPFLVYLGDNLLKSSLQDMIEDFKNSGAGASILLSKVGEPERFGVAKIASGKIVDLVEKPDDPPSNLAIVGVYLFNSNIFPAIERIEPSDRGELEITDAIARLISSGQEVTPSRLGGWWLDVGRPRDAIEANEILLKEKTSTRNEAKLINSKIADSSGVETKAGSKFENSKIAGPLSVGAGTKIINSKIGPYVSVGKNARIENAELSRSIVMEGASIKNTKLVNSIIGSKVKLDFDGRELEARLGNNAEIEPSEGKEAS